MPKYLIFLFVLLGAQVNTFCQNKKAIGVELSMQNRKISSYKDFYLNLRLTTDVPDVKMPFRNCLIYCFDSKICQPNKPDIILEVQKSENNSFKKAAKRATSDHAGGICYDSTGKEAYDTLSIKNPLNYTKNMAPYYVFRRGNYRVRIVLNIPNLSGKKGETVFSDWVYFYVKNSEIDYSDFGN